MSTSTTAPAHTTASVPTGTETGILVSHRVVHFTGRDAASFLQGYLTCDTEQLLPNRALPGAFTNLKGRVVANGWVWGDAQQVGFLTSHELTETLAVFLRPYLNFSRTKLTAADTPPLASIGQTNPDAGVVRVDDLRGLTDADDPLPEEALADMPDVSEFWQQQAIARHEVLVRAATTGTYLPQMLGLTDLGAVAFDKGCYLGQEVVARAQHRGEVKRRLRHIRYEANAALNPGEELLDAGGKRAATVINASAKTALIVTAQTETGAAEFQGPSGPLRVEWLSR